MAILPADRWDSVSPHFYYVAVSVPPSVLTMGVELIWPEGFCTVSKRDRDVTVGELDLVSTNGGCASWVAQEYAWYMLGILSAEYHQFNIL